MLKETFKEGSTYSARSVCDHNCQWLYTVVRRTPKTVWLREEGATEVKAFRITIYNGVEQVFPSGRYSMAPILGADKHWGTR